MNNEKAVQQEDGVLVEASSPAWMLLFLPLLWEWWDFPQSAGESSWKEARVSPPEGIPGSGTETGASCTVEEFIHAKKILLASRQMEWCYRGGRVVEFRLLHPPLPFRVLSAFRKSPGRVF